MTRAAIYARVSTFDQEPENQLQELRRYTTARLDRGRVRRQRVSDHTWNLEELIALLGRCSTVAAEEGHL
jgi:DNA invertase Pin-like site-specific DNA recombinase